MGTHIPNNPLHCSQLLSELLEFELNFCKYRPMFICLCNESDNSISNANYLNILCCFLLCYDAFSLNI